MPLRSIPLHVARQQRRGHPHGFSQRNYRISALLYIKELGASSRTIRPSCRRRPSSTRMSTCLRKCRTGASYRGGYCAAQAARYGNQASFRHGDRARRPTTTTITIFQISPGVIPVTARSVAKSGTWEGPFILTSRPSRWTHGLRRQPVSPCYHLALHARTWLFRRPSRSAAKRSH